MFRRIVKPDTYSRSLRADAPHITFSTSEPIARPPPDLCCAVQNTHTKLSCLSREYFLPSRHRFYEIMQWQQRSPYLTDLLFGQRAGNEIGTRTFLACMLLRSVSCKPRTVCFARIASQTRRVCGFRLVKITLLCNVDISRTIISCFHGFVDLVISLKAL